MSSGKRASTAALERDARGIVKAYAELLEPVQGPVSVWARVEDGILHLYTLILPDEVAERAVYGAELALLARLDPESVDFDLYRDPEALQQLLGTMAPDFHRA